MASTTVTEKPIRVTKAWINENFSSTNAVIDKITVAENIIFAISYKKEANFSLRTDIFVFTSR
ncbi:MAG: hypothetical protein KBT34_14195 [Prevotella sp.]|nr:hypothetical protein [Candidatus Prevotella equi]